MFCSQAKKKYQSKACRLGDLKKQSEDLCYLIKGEIDDLGNGCEEGQVVLKEG